MEKSTHRGNIITFFENQRTYSGCLPPIPSLPWNWWGSLSLNGNSSKRQTLDVGLELNSISYIEN